MNDTRELARQQRITTASGPLPPARSGLLTPYEPGTRTIPAGFQAGPQFREVPQDVVLEKDVPVTLRDGVTILMDVFRPVGDEPVPAIVAWSPYGKGQGTSPSVTGVFALVGLSDSVVSGLEKFEGPDPAFWCGQGYAICHPDPRGCIDSEGDSYLWDRQEGRDCHDVIEWIAEQPWCTGKVGMSGTSYLAASQWFTAAEQPPHLAAINPWEGISDTYRDLAVRGGIPDTGFAGLLQRGSFFGRGQKEDMLAEVERYPLMTALWEEKIPDYERITVPAYVVASYTNTLHTPGTFRAWRRIASEQAWLRIHAGQEWPDYYNEGNRADLLRFFDHFLRGVDNGWEQTPKVRYSLLDLQGGGRENLPAESFPPAGVQAREFFLDADRRTLEPACPAREASASYEMESGPGLVSFTMAFERETTLLGYPSVTLWVEAQDADDLDLFVFLQKLDAQGTPLQEFTVPNRNARLHDATEHGGTVLRYKGSDGRLRASLRELDEQRTTIDVPEHTFATAAPLQPGEIVEVRIALAPLGLVVYPGEQLRLVISGRNLFGPWMPNLPEFVSPFGGTHVVHTGDAHPSRLRLPVLDA